jgi:hypothetical protein
MAGLRLRLKEYGALPFHERENQLFNKTVGASSAPPAILGPSARNIP